MSHTIKCLSVTVRFNKPHMQAQAIRFSDGPDASIVIQVVHDDL
jgi:hypothetical protein